MRSAAEKTATPDGQRGVPRWRVTYARTCFSTFAILAGTPNSFRHTSASTATPSRIWSCEGLAKTQPQPAAGIGLVGRPFRSRIDGDAGGERGLVELQRVDIVGQLYPQEDAALGVLEFSRGAELLVERFHQRVELGAQAARQLRHVAAEMRRAIFRQHHLLERAAAGVGLQRQHPRQHLPWRDDEADPQRRRDRFGKRADMDDAAVLAHRMERGRALAVPDQVGIAVVLEDRHAVLLRQLQQFGAARLGHDGAGRVLHGRDGVDVFRRDAAALQVGQRRRQRVHPHAVWSSGMPTTLTPSRVSRFSAP